MTQPFELPDFSAPSDVLAKALIGTTFLHGGVGGIIVETEAYDQADPASHSFPGRTERNAVMFEGPGRIYVYRSYGIHWCVNITCREAGHGAAVLIRAIEPTEGLELMRKRRKKDDIRQLCSGPGKLCEAMGISRTCNGLKLNQGPITLLPRQADCDVLIGPRIGITKAVEVPWRFGLTGSPYLSRNFPRRA